MKRYDIAVIAGDGIGKEEQAQLQSRGPACGDASQAERRYTSI
jgi:hypothetical protein